MEHSASFFSVHQPPWPLHSPVQPHAQQTTPAEGYTPPSLAPRRKFISLNKSVPLMVMNWMCTHPGPQNRAINYTLVIDRRNQSKRVPEEHFWSQEWRVSVYDPCIKPQQSKKISLKNKKTRAPATRTCEFFRLELRSSRDIQFEYHTLGCSKGGPKPVIPKGECDQ